MAKTATVVFAGNASDLIKAAEQARAAMDATAGSAEKSAAKIEASQAKAAESTKKSAEAFGKWGTIAAVGIAAGTAKMAIDLEHASAKIAQAGGTSTASAKKITDAFKNLSGLEYSAAKVGEAFSTVAGELAQVAHHSLGTNEAVKVMKAALDLADASGTDLTKTTEALGKTMLVYHLSAGKAAEASNILFLASKKTGNTIEATAEAVQKIHGRLGVLGPSLKESAGLMVEFAEHGIKGREALSGLNGMFTTLIGGGKKVTETLKTLNVHLFDQNGKFVGLRSVLQQLDPALSKYDEKSQLALTKVILGAQANKKLLEIIHQGPAAYEAATRATSEHGKVTEAAAKQHKTLDGLLKITKAQLANVAATLGEQLIPALAKAATALGEGINWLKKHHDAAKALAYVISAVLGAAMVDFAVTKVAKFVGGIKEAITWLKALVGANEALVKSNGAGSFVSVAGTAESSAGRISTAFGALAARAGPIIGVALALDSVKKTLEEPVHEQGGSLWSDLAGFLTGGQFGNKTYSPLNLARLALGEHEPGAQGAQGAQGAGKLTGNSYGAMNGQGQGQLGKSNQYPFVSEIARKFGIDPNTLWGVYGKETTYGAKIETSSAGAMGAFQFEPETAKAYSYPLTNHPNAKQFREQAEAAARYLQVLKNQYHSESSALSHYSGGAYSSAKGGAPSGYGSQTWTEQAKKAKAKAEAMQSPQAIVRWAEQSVGKFAESEGSNRGPELNKLQAEFHTTAAAWCAEFATTAAMMGGANKAVRTASVATIREWANQGSHGYMKGVSNTPHVGSLMMFGDQHVGFVQSVHGQDVTVIEGNANGSGGVVRRTRKASEGDYATPIYKKMTTGAGELAEAAKGFANAAKLAEKLVLTMGQTLTLSRFTGAAGGFHAAAERSAGTIGEIEGNQGAAERGWARHPLNLATATGAKLAIGRDVSKVGFARAEKKYFELEIQATKREATQWRKARDLYHKIARHTLNGKAAKMALEEAAKYDAKYQQAQAKVKELGGKLEGTEEAISTGEGEAAKLPGEIQEADLGAYGQANSKIDAEVRAGILTADQGKAAKIANANKALSGGYGALSEEGVLQVKGDLKEFSEALTEGTNALEAHTEALKEATKSLTEFTQAGNNIARVEAGSSAKSLADVISGQIAGVAYNGRQLGAGVGTAARY